MKIQPGNTTRDEQRESLTRPPDAAENERSQQNRASVGPRDYLANERTLLAWIRTGIALIALGFVVARFGLFLRELGLHANPSAQDLLVGHGLSSVVGTLIILLSVLLLALSYLRYRGAVRALDLGMYHHNQSLTVALVAIVILIALGLAAYLLLTS
jgi:putative membrane protein